MTEHGPSNTAQLSLPSPTGNYLMPQTWAGALHNQEEVMLAGAAAH